jgi:hypothetical protein
MNPRIDAALAELTKTAAPYQRPGAAIKPPGPPRPVGPGIAGGGVGRMPPGTTSAPGVGAGFLGRTQGRIGGAMPSTQPPPPPSPSAGMAAAAARFSGNGAMPAQAPYRPVAPPPQQPQRTLPPAPLQAPARLQRPAMQKTASLLSRIKAWTAK